MQVRTGLALAGLGMVLGGGVLAAATDGAAKKVGLGLAAGGTLLGLGSLASAGRSRLAVGVGAVGAGALLLSACGGGKDREAELARLGGRDQIKANLPGFADGQDPAKAFSSVDDIVAGVMITLDASGDGKLDMLRGEQVPKGSYLDGANWTPGNRLTDESALALVQIVGQLEVKRRDGTLDASSNVVDSGQTVIAHASQRFGDPRSPMSESELTSYVASFDADKDGFLTGAEMTEFRTDSALYPEAG